MTDAKRLEPLSWPPSQYWDGDDGSWSSFHLRVGSPEQIVRVLPSTAGSAILVVTEEGCRPPSVTCGEERGGLFNIIDSKSRKKLGNYTLELEENLGRHESGMFGLDTVALGLSNATAGPSLDSQLVVGIDTNVYYTGIFGLSDQPFNVTSFEDTHPSFLTTLKEQRLIPSLSWAYTAGARYHSKGFFGSLTLGGSDISRYTPNNVSFDLGDDISRDLVVGVQMIMSTNHNGASQLLLKSPILAFIDSTVPYLYLPLEACQMFEKELGLVWDSSTNLYPVDEGLHQHLLGVNPTFKFVIGNDESSSQAVDINMPYASFDIIAKPPLLPKITLLFPLRRAQNETQYTLGRTFLQETYLITNYEYRNFSISQTRFDDGLQPELITLPSIDNTDGKQNDHVGRKVTIGIGLGVGIFITLVLLFLSFLIQKKRRKVVETNFQDSSDAELDPDPIALTDTTQEMGRNSLYGAPQELHNSETVELSDAQAVSGSRDRVVGVPLSATPSSLESQPFREISIVYSTDPPSPQAERTKPMSSTVARLSSSTQAGGQSSRFPILHANKPLPATPASFPKMAAQDQGLARNSSQDSNVNVAKTRGLKHRRHGRFLAVTAEQDSLWARPGLSRLPTAIFQDSRVSPLLSNVDKFSFLRQEYHTVQSESASNRSTYATIFDYDDYRDSSADEESPVEVLRDQLFRHINKHPGNGWETSTLKSQASVKEPHSDVPCEITEES